MHPDFCSSILTVPERICPEAGSGSVSIPDQSTGQILLLEFMQ
jgi:hypothetical protein